MPSHRLLLPLVLLVACAATGCERERAATAAGETDAGIALPQPDADADAGSVTGMPDAPGPGAIGPPRASETEPGPGTLPLPGMELPMPVDLPGEPAATDAVAVLRDYYAAIVNRDYARAHSLWSGGGEASGQTLEQFAAGFADTASVVAEPGAPGRVEPAAGSRFIEIPVSVVATRSDGSVHRYLGSYTLRRAVVDGASAEQRAWRIATADIREVK